MHNLTYNTRIIFSITTVILTLQRKQVTPSDREI